MNCPNCNSVISRENINISTDIGQCQTCDHIFKISENLNNDIDDEFDINTPPNGAWITKKPQQITVGATTRSLLAFFLVPFMLVWSGGSLGGIYGSQIISGKFDLAISLFGIPFILGSILFWGLTIMSIWGKVEMTLDQIGGKLFTGVGSIGRRKTFTWEEISTIKEVQIYNRKSSGQSKEIVLEGKKRISFGTGINESRRYYLYKSLKIIFVKAKSNKRFIID